MPFTYFAQAAHSQYSYSHSQNSHTWRNIQYYCTLFNVYIVSVWVCVRVRIGLLVLCMCFVCYVCSPKPKRYSILYVYKLVFSSSVFQSAFLSFWRLEMLTHTCIYVDDDFFRSLVTFNIFFYSSWRFAFKAGKFLFPSLYTHCISTRATTR